MPLLADDILDSYVPLVTAALLDHMGRENAVPGDDLAIRVGLVTRAGAADTRSLRLVVHYARTRHQKPILSAPGGGYFRPRTQDEIDHCYRQIRSSAIQQLVACRTLRRFASREVHDSDGWLDAIPVDRWSTRQAELPLGV